MALGTEDMPIAVLRQMCWAIWLASTGGASAAQGNLIPQMKTITSLTGPPAKILSISQIEELAFLHLVLVVSERIAICGSHGLPTDSAEKGEDEWQQLTMTLATAFPKFLADLHYLKPGILDFPRLVCLLERIVRITCRITSYDMSQPFTYLDILTDLDYIDIVDNTLDLLLHAFRNLDKIQQHDQSSIIRIVFGATCTVAELRRQPPEKLSTSIGEQRS